MTQKHISRIESGYYNAQEENMSTFFLVTFLRSEYRISNGRMDSIGIDENNCPVIFEYKRSVNENVINQGLYYLDWLLDHKADFKLLVMEILGKDKANVIDWSMPCVICIANDFTKFDEHAVNQMQRNIKLVRYRKFGDGLLALEQLNSPQFQLISESTDSQSQSKKIIVEIRILNSILMRLEKKINIYFILLRITYFLLAMIFPRISSSFMLLLRKRKMLYVLKYIKAR